MNAMEAACEASSSSAGASEEFAQRMARMQAELAEMQRIEQSVKQEYGKSTKTIHALQNELTNVSKSLTAAESKRIKLEKELKQCVEEIDGLKSKKELVQSRIYDVTASAEQKKLDKLRAMGMGSTPQATPAKAAAPTPGLNSTAVTAGSSDLLGGLADLDFSSNQAPNVDLIGNFDFGAPPVNTGSSAAIASAATPTPQTNSAMMYANTAAGGACAMPSPAMNAGVFNAYGMPVGAAAAQGGMAMSAPFQCGMPQAQPGMAPAAGYSGMMSSGGMMNSGNGMGFNSMGGNSMGGNSMGGMGMGGNGMGGNNMAGNSMGGVSQVPGAPMPPSQAQPDAQFLQLLGMGGN